MSQVKLMISLINPGMAFGTAFCFIITGFIINHFGWPMVYYLSGLSTILWFIFWSCLISNTPSDHPSITPNELNYIQTQLNVETNNSNLRHKSPPWRKVIKSLPFWAAFVGQCTEAWGMYTYKTELPTYMKTLLHFDMADVRLY